MNQKNVLISMCLLGVNCRYDGNNNLNNEIIELLNKNGYNAVPVCPEQLGGLSTPRKPSEILADGNCCKVINCDGEDVTCNFNRGANEALKAAKLYGCEFCILKAKSPSCGFGLIYDGTFSGRLVSGSGVTAKAMNENGYKVFNEKQTEEILEYIKKQR